ncbi:hypothetical protein HAX54_007526 [Datura stramonium]|uniref:Uncharacterized protein n=1 Tax=Datura stramonium TaxID=4076 RepID=A0ABS8WUR7_DATST|nr:hypothetical protein [Datura stramonium]
MIEKNSTNLSRSHHNSSSVRPGPHETASLMTRELVLGKGEGGEEGAALGRSSNSLQRRAWLCSQRNFVTFIYRSDGNPFGVVGPDSLCLDWRMRKPSAEIMFSHDLLSSCRHSHLISLESCHQKLSSIGGNVPLRREKSISMSRCDESLEP